MNFLGILNMTRRQPPTEMHLSRNLWLRLLRKREAQIGVILGGVILLMALFGPFIEPYDPALPDYDNRMSPPTAVHTLGTDATGRDQLSRILDGAPRSLGASVLVLGAVFGIGLVVGVTAGMLGGLVDVVIMRFVDVLMALPGLVMAIAIVGVLGPGFQNLLLALVVADWAYYARLARSYALSARTRPDVITARLAGIGWARIIAVHILPGVAAQLAVIATLGLGGTITAISGLSYLGLGVQPPLAEWGGMLAESRFYFQIAPWLLIVPAGFIFLSVISANLIGNALRDALQV